LKKVIQVLCAASTGVTGAEAREGERKEKTK